MTSGTVSATGVRRRPTRWWASCRRRPPRQRCGGLRWSCKSDGGGAVAEALAAPPVGLARSDDLAEVGVLEQRDLVVAGGTAVGQGKFPSAAHAFGGRLGRAGGAHRHRDHRSFLLSLSRPTLS